MPESRSHGHLIIGIDQRGSEKIGRPASGSATEGPAFFLTEAPPARRALADNTAIDIKSGTGAGRVDISGGPVTRR